MTAYCQCVTAEPSYLCTLLGHRRSRRRRLSRMSRYPNWGWTGKKHPTVGRFLTYVHDVHPNMQHGTITRGKKKCDTHQDSEGLHLGVDILDTADKSLLRRAFFGCPRPAEVSGHPGQSRQQRAFLGTSPSQDGSRTAYFCWSQYTRWQSNDVAVRCEVRIKPTRRPRGRHRHRESEINTRGITGPIVHSHRATVHRRDE